MNLDSRAGEPRHVQARLQATLFCGDRLFPVTLTDLSEEGFTAEGVGLDRVEPEFLLDVTLPATLVGAWSPKAAGAAPRGPAASQLRLPARLEKRDGGDVVSRLQAAFLSLSDDTLTSVRRWLARQSAHEQPVTRGIGPRGAPG